MSINDIQNDIIDEFSALDDWMDKYALLIEYGKDLEPFAESDRTDENLIDGCQSKVWFTAQKENGLIIYHGDSDAILVRGIIALLIKVLSRHTAEEILNCDLYFLDKIELKAHLSPTRGNGMVAMLERMLAYARQMQ